MRGEIKQFEGFKTWFWDDYLCVEMICKGKEKFLFAYCVSWDYNLFKILSLLPNHFQDPGSHKLPIWEPKNRIVKCIIQNNLIDTKMLLVLNENLQNTETHSFVVPDITSVENISEIALE